jgi:hypothetical protein
MLERLLRMRQGHYLFFAKLFERVSLSSWRTAAIAMVCGAVLGHVCSATTVLAET